MGNEKYFDENVLNYDKYRPTYGQEIYKDIIAYTGINIKSRILEIGCGTGNATLPLIKTGADVTAIEIGGNLAAYTSVKLAGYDNFRVLNLPFEEYKTAFKYDLILSATAFHWIKSNYGYPRCLDLLEDGGALALFWNTPHISENNPDLGVKIEELYGIYLPDGSLQSLTDGIWYTKRCDDLNSLLESYGYNDRKFKLYYDYRTFNADECRLAAYIL